MKQETKEQMIEVLDQAFKIFHESVNGYIKDLEQRFFIYSEEDEGPDYEVTYRPDPEGLIHDDYEFWVKIQNVSYFETVTFTINLKRARVTRKTEDGEQIIKDTLYEIPTEYKFYDIDDELELWSIPIAQFFHNDGKFYPERTARLLEKFSGLEENRTDALDFKKYLGKSKTEKQNLYWSSCRTLKEISSALEDAKDFMEPKSFKHLELVYLQKVVEQEKKFHTLYSDL